MESSFQISDLGIAFSFQMADFPAAETEEQITEMVDQVAIGDFIEIGNPMAFEIIENNKERFSRSALEKLAQNIHGYIADDCIGIGVLILDPLKAAAQMPEIVDCQTIGQFEAIIKRIPISRIYYEPTDNRSVTVLFIAHNHRDVLINSKWNQD